MWCDNGKPRSLSFAGAATKNNVTSTIVGSGRCKEVGAAGDERGVVAPEVAVALARWLRLRP